MHGILVTIVLLSAPYWAHAATLHKCVGSDGVPSYQSAPCGPDQTSQWSRQVVPDSTKPVAPPARSARATSSPATWSARHVAPQRVPTARDRQQQRCNNAKTRRDATLDRIGLRRTYELLQRLDAAVRVACKRL